MNERLRELIAQATKVSEPDDPDYRYEFFDKEKFAALVAAAEREACAKVCEETIAAWMPWDYNGACIDCAKAIRAQGGNT